MATQTTPKRHWWSRDPVAEEAPERRWRPRREPVTNETPTRRWRVRPEPVTEETTERREPVTKETTERRWPPRRARVVEEAPAAERAKPIERVRNRRAWVHARERRRNPVSALAILAGWAAALILLAGIGLHWADANQGNAIVHAVLRAGIWLATPFHDVFRNADARDQLTENWALAAGVYLAAGKVLGRLLRW